MFLNSPVARHRFVAWCILVLVANAWLVHVQGQVQGQSNPDTPRPTKSTDATIRDCAAPSADRIWAVGDRGLILTTDNGGRNWTPQESFTEIDLKGVAFDSEKIGWIVGGRIQPYSHRSVGVFLSTRDGGLNWTTGEVAELPNLAGIQSFGNGHLIVWGDWSPLFQTGLLESFDGGSTWNPRMIPASHLQTSAWRDPQTGIVVDRLSRVFYLSANSPPELLGFAGDPTKPILAASINEAGWWLVGANGQVYWSSDGRRWSPRSLPGNSQDHRLISLHSIELAGDHAWLVGMPGNMIWHTENRGLKWDVQTISTALPMHSICALTPDSLVVAGTLTNIYGTRNRGRGWWPIHSAGTRLAILDIATTVDQLAWDALGYMANESRHQAAGLVIHTQRVHERADAFCDRDRRTVGLASPIGLSFVNICPQFPVSDLPSGRRDSDVTSYLSIANEPSTIARQLALWIRATRPDVLVCDTPIQEDPLLIASSDAVRTARRLAGDSAFHCFSPEAGIVEQAWNCKRVLTRNAERSNAARTSTTRRSELDYSATTAMKSTGRLLAEVLVPVIPTIEKYQENGDGGQEAFDKRLYSEYLTIHGNASKSGKDHLVMDLANGSETSRPVLRSRMGNLQTMVASSQNANLMTRLLEIQGPDIQNDTRWQASLKSFLRSTPAEQHADSLWQLAQGYRHQGYWNRWQFCLETLMAEAPRSGVAELACLQALQFFGSDEVKLFRAKSTNSKQLVEDSPPKQTQTAFISSPFPSATQPAQIASKKEDGPKSYAEEFNRLHASMPTRFPMLQSDPRILVVDASFQRQHTDRSSTSVVQVQQNPIKRLASCVGLHGWSTIAMQELLAGDHSSIAANTEQASNSNSETAFPVSKSTQRPRLDGSLDDSLWTNIKAMPLDDVWKEDRLSKCTIQITHDDEFLFIAATCLRAPRTTEVPQIAKPESLTFRFDTDRDYLTWFELNVDQDGKVVERCTDMDGWQPKWYFKTESNENAWIFEAAIPIAELQSEPITSNSTWAIAIQRSIPNRGVQMSRAMYADRLLFTSSRLIRFHE